MDKFKKVEKVEDLEMGKYYYYKIKGYNTGRVGVLEMIDNGNLGLYNTIEKYPITTNFGSSVFYELN